jgi:hypothetical protein
MITRLTGVTSLSAWLVRVNASWPQAERGPAAATSVVRSVSFQGPATTILAESAAWRLGKGGAYRDRPDLREPAGKIPAGHPTLRDGCLVLSRQA